MKQFLYLDTDIVNSIIAQSEKGLVLSFSNEKEAANSETATSTAVAEGKGTLGSSLFKLAKAEASLTGSLETVEHNASTYTAKELIAKTLHDAAFDMAYTQIAPIEIKVSDSSHDDTGNYVELTRVFDFIDFDYLEGLFAKEGIIEYIKKSEAEKIEKTAKEEKASSGINRETIRKSGVNIKAEIQQLILKNNKQYEEIASIIKAIRSLIPYNRMLISHDGYLVPLSEKYFRVDHSDIGFKYGGEITCVGLITNIIGESCEPIDDSNIFATLQHTSNEALRKLLPTKERDLCVIHPIAIYYGN